MTNVLFVCLGNSCRSQMAEGFARKYGTDVIRAWSAGLAPAPYIQPLTIQVMSQKNIDIQDQFPKNVSELELDAFDVIVNMCGLHLPRLVRCELRNWNVLDPMSRSEEVYIQVRDQIEGLVMQYIMELRRAKRTASTRPESEKQLPPPVDPGVQPTQRYRFGRVRKARD